MPLLKQKYSPDIIIANGENSAGGRGITAKIANELFNWGIHGITMGNHTWDNKDIFQFIEQEARMIRPANYPAGTPGRGYAIIKNNKKQLVIMNIMGRTFLPPLDCPFNKMDEMLQELTSKYKCILVDFHAEATSEKIAMGWHLDGRVSILLGTHTHVQTNDHILLPQGTAYVTDVGMVATRNSVLGMDKEAVLRRFQTQLPVRFQTAEGKWCFHGIFVEIDESSGKSKQIELIRMDEDDVIFH